MKKLMIAASAALCATVSFAELASANVVGYAKNDTVNGFTVVTPQFRNINDGNFSLLSFSAGEDMYDNLTVNQIDEYGTSIHTYTWTTSADDGTDSYEVLPSIRDFRGVSSKLDGAGNYNYGISDHTIFPEVTVDPGRKNIGMDITIVTTATDDKSGRELLKLLGMPFRKSSSETAAK